MRTKEREIESKGSNTAQFLNRQVDVEIHDPPSTDGSLNIEVMQVYIGKQFCVRKHQCQRKFNILANSRGRVNLG